MNDERRHQWLRYLIAQLNPATHQQNDLGNVLVYQNNATGAQPCEHVTSMDIAASAGQASSLQPDLVPCDCFLFSPLKSKAWGRNFNSAEKVVTNLTANDFGDSFFHGLHKRIDYNGEKLKFPLFVILFFSNADTCWHLQHQFPRNVDLSAQGIVSNSSIHFIADV